MLFCGPDGVGKRQFAVELARTLVCTSPTSGSSCGQCSPCRRAGTFNLPDSDKKDGFERVIFGEHADIGIVVPYNRTILVEAVRDLEREANFRPFESAGRFFIVDQAEKMNDNAANALLKTLEEPPAGVRIVLVTSRPDRLLQTIRSRCQTIRFMPVETASIERSLVAAGRFSPAEAAIAAGISGGSVGRAFNLDLATHLKIRSAMIQVVRGSVAKRDLPEILATSERLTEAKNKDHYEASLEVLETLVRDVWTIASGGGELIINRDIGDELTAIAQNADRNQLAGWVNAIEKLRGDLIVNVNRKIATDALLVGMAA
jgi:DNA polymerase-3 subunit delta'